MVGLVTVVVIGWLLMRRDGLPLPRAALCLSVLTFLVLWSLPLSEALTNHGGNVRALWRFFVTEARADHSIREALITGSYALVGVLRPDFDLPWGGHFDLAYLWWAIPASLALVAGLVVVAR